MANLSAQGCSACHTGPHAEHLAELLGRPDLVGRGPAEATRTTPARHELTLELDAIMAEDLEAAKSLLDLASQ